MPERSAPPERSGNGAGPVSREAPAGSAPDRFDRFAGYADRFAVEPPAVRSARQRVARLSGPAPVEPAVGATLAVLAAGRHARGVVCIGSGGGVAGLWLLSTMRPDGLLTVLDSDAEQLRAARQAFVEAGVAANRTRLIFGTAAEVLPRLSPGAYDLVSCAGPPLEYAAQRDTLLALLRPGGTLSCHGLLAGGGLPERTARDPQAAAWRELARAVQEDETLTSAVLPVGAGLLVATKRS